MAELTHNRFFVTIICFILGATLFLPISAYADEGEDMMVDDAAIQLEAPSNLDEPESSTEEELETMEEPSELDPQAVTSLAQYNKGSFGFFERMGATDALAALTSSSIASYTKKGDIEDATSLLNMKNTIQWLKKCNQLRKANGLNELKVTHTLMAYAQADANYSDKVIGHASVFPVGENVAWNYGTDPYIQWYDQEKRNYETNNGGQTGHYLNIIAPSYSLTGFAISTRGSMNNWNTYAQVFSYTPSGEKSYTVAEYEKLFNAYYDEVAPVIVYRLYQRVNGEHLYTTDANEVRVLRYQHSWTYEGAGWYAPKTGTPVYRLYNPGLQNHLYTTDKNEIKVLTNGNGWQLDNNGKELYYSGGNTDIFRLYNKGLSGQHLLTTDLNEYKVLPKHGWKQEGAAVKCLGAGTSSYPFPTA